MKIKNILIVVIGDTGNEPEALRQVLEGFNYFVALKYIARPNDFIDVLNCKLPFEPDCFILSCHGDNGKILMPVLANEVYEKDEPRGDFSFNEVDKYIKLCGKIILNLGCTTGMPELATVFSKHNTYIAPKDYIDGNSALFFTIKLFYEIAQNNKNIYDAYVSAKGNDKETNLFSYVK